MDKKELKFTTAELEQNGYQMFFERQKVEPDRRFESPLTLGKEKGIHPYKGTWQKCIRDQGGKKYFINLEFWDFSDSEFKHLINSGPSFQAQAQLQTIKELRFNISLLHAGELTLKELEAWFELQWTTNGSVYYETKEQE